MRIPTSLCNQLLLQESTLNNYCICTFSTIIPNASSKKVYGRQILALFLRLVKSAPFVREKQLGRHSEKKTNHLILHHSVPFTYDQFVVKELIMLHLIENCLALPSLH